jgi:uncharacterized protein Veg
MAASLLKGKKRRKMIKAQLKSNFVSIFLLSLKEKTDVKERESLKL